MTSTINKEEEEEAQIGLKKQFRYRPGVAQRVPGS
jgi:hypothetical protein